MRAVSYRIVNDYTADDAALAASWAAVREPSAKRGAVPPGLFRVVCPASTGCAVLVSCGSDADDARTTAAAALEAVAGAAATTRAEGSIGFLGELVPARATDLLNGETARRTLN
ncbi:hypothetical protein [Pseudarthrobacter sp. Y6]|uniref:hypothetical protein n=1 Tax=Pseudarthrobacter sp. Y6 TaxID=3418422 RepID=UPI003CEC2E47